MSFDGSRYRTNAAGWRFWWLTIRGSTEFANLIITRPVLNSVAPGMDVLNLVSAGVCSIKRHTRRLRVVLKKALNHPDRSRTETALMGRDSISK
jgi:hypothetical protein